MVAITSSSLAVEIVTTIPNGQFLGHLKSILYFTDGPLTFGSDGNGTLLGDGVTLGVGVGVQVGVEVLVALGEGVAERATTVSFASAVWVASIDIFGGR